MERFIIVTTRGGNVSAFNTALFTSEKEAKKSMGWYQAKIKAEHAAHKKYWGINFLGVHENILLSVAKVTFTPTKS